MTQAVLGPPSGGRNFFRKGIDFMAVIKYTGNSGKERQVMQCHAQADPRQRTQESTSLRLDFLMMNWPCSPGSQSKRA